MSSLLVDINNYNKIKKVTKNLIKRLMWRPKAFTNLSAGLNKMVSFLDEFMFVGLTGILLVWEGSWNGVQLFPSVLVSTVK